MIERDSRENGLGRQGTASEGGVAWQESSLAHFPGIGGESVPCTVLGTVMESEFVVGHKHLVTLSVLTYLWAPGPFLLEGY